MRGYDALTPCRCDEFQAAMFGLMVVRTHELLRPRPRISMLPNGLRGLLAR
jgi:hypothetical protein